MTKILLPVKLKLLLAALAIFLAGFAAQAQESQPFSLNTSPLPAPTGFVNDYAGVIDAATKQQLETKLKNLKETTNPSVEIAVAVVKTTSDRPIFDYSLAVARGWKIGTKEDDNPSALLFVAIDDRKYFTQVSKDLEDELPDGLVGSLQRQYLVPEFRQGNYGKGISDTIDAYIATIQRKNSGTVAPQKPTPEREKSSGLSLAGIFCCGGIILVILLLIFSRSKGGRKDDDDDSWGGGAASALPWVIGSILSNSGSSSGSSSSWGGSSSGGGSDWGGFGGGGDFGGGGGGGDW